MNGYTFRGRNSVIFNLTSLANRGQHLRERISALKSRILFFKSRPCFKRAALSRKANSKSEKLFPFVSMIVNHGGVLIHLNTAVRDLTLRCK